VQELQTALWHWEAPHPDWTPGNPDDEGAKVTSYAIDDGERLLLLDPLTCPWHERDARSLVEQLGAPVFLPPPDEGNNDVEWLRDDRPLLELPVELVLPTHGAPTDRAALEHALS
jgi:hypothetical protein